jgi:AbrB family looped-hinge helix DNA binding protein
MKSVMGERGQVTIPKELRRRLGLQPGQEVRFEERRGVLVLRKALAEKSPLDNLWGIIDEKIDVDTYLEQTRGPAWTPELDPEELS